MLEQGLMTEMTDRTRKVMLSLVWIGIVSIFGMAVDAPRDTLDWLLWAVHAGVVGGLVVVLVRLYRQVRANAIKDYRFSLLWRAYAKEHDLNGDVGED